MSRILIVENDRLVRNCLRDFLVYLGHDCICADHGSDALTVLQTSISIHLIITDLHMPVMDGLQLLEALQQGNPRGKIPAILISGKLTAELTQRAKDAGVLNIFAKPYDFRALAHTITQILSADSVDGSVH